MNFDKTDKLISKLDYGALLLRTGPLCLKNDPELPISKYSPVLYEKLKNAAAIGAHDPDSADKTYLIFAEFYKKPGDLLYGKKMCDLTFNQDERISQLNNALNFSFSYIDIEQEFWENCTDLNHVDSILNLYRERWSDHLYSFDLKYYDLDQFLFEESHPWNRIFNELRLIKLLTVGEEEMEAKFEHLAFKINFISDQIIKIFKSIRTSFNNPQESSINKTNDTKGSNHNKFNGQPIDEVKRHFSVLKEMVSKTNKKALFSSDQFDTFIHNAFIDHGNINPKLTINKGRQDGANIQRVFWTYWDAIKRESVYFSTNNNVREDYIKLLTDNINGFEFHKVLNNFSRYK